MVYIQNLSVMNIVGERRRPLVTVLPTARITLHTPTGNHSIRVLLSLESWQNFISEECLKKFDLPLLGGAPPIHVLDGKMKHISGKTKITISSRFGGNDTRTLDVLVTDHVTSMVPSDQLHTSVKEPLLHFQLADPTFDKPGEIDILLGRELLSDILKEDEYSIPDTFCFAHDTVFGWLVMGGAPIEDGPEVFLIG